MNWRADEALKLCQETDYVNVNHRGFVLLDNLVESVVLQFTN